MNALEKKEMRASNTAKPLERDGRRVQPLFRNRNEVEVTTGCTAESRDNGSEQIKSHYKQVPSDEGRDKCLGLRRNSNTIHIGIKYLHNPNDKDCSLKVTTDQGIKSYKMNTLDNYPAFRHIKKWYHCE
jgi:hypothetical protein